MQKKAQFSFDLLVIIGIMLVLFLLVFSFYSQKAQSADIIKTKTDALKITQGLADKINAVLISGNGTSAPLAIPSKLIGQKSYSLSIVGRRVEASFDNSQVASAILTSDVTAFDLNSRIGGQLLIKNLQGSIILE